MLVGPMTPRHSAAAGILAVLAAGCSAEPPPAAPGPGTSAVAAPAFAERLPDLPVENAARVADGLYRGAQPDSAGLRALRERGVKTIVCLRSAAPERKEAEALGMEVVEIPMEAGLTCPPPTDAQVMRFFEVVLDPAKRPLFFHCAQGRDRTGVMAAIYRIEVDGWTPKRAMAETESFGYHGWYRALEEFIEGYRPRGFRRPGAR